MRRDQLVVRYMGVMAWWLIASGVAYITLASGEREVPAFRVVDDAISLTGWGIVMLALGVLSLGAWLWPRPTGTRAVLSASMSVKFSFAVGLWLAGDELARPWTWSPGVISYLMLATLDALLIRERYLSKWT